MTFSGIPYQGGNTINNIRAAIYMSAANSATFTSGFTPILFNVHSASGETPFDTGLGGTYDFDISNVVVESNYDCNSFVYFNREAVTRPIIFNLANCVCRCSNTFARVSGTANDKNITYNFVNVSNTGTHTVTACTYTYAAKTSMVNASGFTLGYAVVNEQNNVPMVLYKGTRVYAPSSFDMLTLETDDGLCNLRVIGATVGNTKYFGRIYIGNADEPNKAYVSASANGMIFWVDNTATLMLSTNGQVRPVSSDGAMLGAVNYPFSKAYITDIGPSGVTLNSVSRTLAARAGDVVNVLDYGAKADGVTDDAAAFTAAAAAAMARGDSVFVPAGTYKVGSAVAGRFHTFGTVKITGSGSVTTIRQL